MSIVKSLSVGDGDMFYIKHNSDSFSIIDCNLNDDDETREATVGEIKAESRGKGVTRFISSHPDEDHIHGLEYLDDEIQILNFYCVKNDATKEDETTGFKRYKELRDSSKAFYLSKGCKRKWLNDSDSVRKSAGIELYWPDMNNADFQSILEQAKQGRCINNLSPILTYSMQDGVEVMWMGDLEKDFMEKIQDELDLPRVHILFAPHHGRDSGKIPESILQKLDPRIIIIGEAPSAELNYYGGYNTITQNSAGDITLECLDKKVHIYVSNPDYTVDFLDDEAAGSFEYYIGTLNL